VTPVDRAVVTRKLQAIVKYLTALQPSAALDLEIYLNDFNQQLISERLLHLIVEAAVDTNSYLLVCFGQPPPETYFASFIEAGRYGLLSPELAQQLAPSAGLRNRLVHEYDAIDPLIVFRAIPLALELYQEYMKEIQVYLEEQ